MGTGRRNRYRSPSRQGGTPWDRGAALDRVGLEVLRTRGVEVVCLDIKAADPEVHRRLTGSDNRNVLAAPALMHEHARAGLHRAYQAG